MPRSSALGLGEIADWENLARAFWRAARGKRERPEVRRFEARLEHELGSLGHALRTQSLHLEPLTAFRIFDPKPRLIEAPCFRERVLHHALVQRIEPVLERTLVDDTFACRRGKGTLAGVRRAQAHARRFPWCVQVDARAYYRSIDHARLREQLVRLFRNEGLRALFDALLAAYAPEPGRGIPIGALTSQHFGNLYLAPLDRFLLEGVRVSGLVRYMDDLVWWCRSRTEARASAGAAIEFAAVERGLELHRLRIQRSACGLTFLGFRVFPSRLELSRRRKRRYVLARQRWEAGFASGAIHAPALQAGYSAALAVTAHAQAAVWRRGELERRPAVDA